MRKLVQGARLLLSALSMLLVLSCLQAQDVLDQVDETYPNITNIEIEGSFCSVDVQGGSSSDVHFTGEIMASRSYDIKIRHNVSGNTLRVWIDRPNSIRGNVKGKLTFKVPENTNLNVDNSSGSVNVANIGEAEVKLKASSGSIKAQSINSSLVIGASSGSLSASDINGDVKANTSSGSQRINGVKGNLTTKASSGSIKVEGVGGDASVTTSSGSQSIQMIEGNVWSKVTSGSLNIAGVTGDVKAASSSGGIRLDRVTGAVNLKSSSGSQKGSNIKLTGTSYFEASSGSVSMDLLNEKDELSFSLSASSGGLSAKGDKGRKKMIIERGPIKIVGSTSSGSQSYR
ncbi:DUF4097 family beta strand repeat-containing protein [Carboxylicivirga sp. N1Y90]|uniref:DUF4097 family beta strand repeat-containing protein n=1 Tax=Carboxylicivirga fragile TaxID=3417571 RepID=UPI003D32538C|nr:DUF4097 family beta strand repeat protein [Marinilabiliaceae bacterium N1Y90]